MTTKNSKLTKGELSRIGALHEAGVPKKAIARQVGRDTRTVRRYLQSDVFRDPEIREMIDSIKAKEIEDLCLIGAKARQRIHELLDGGNVKPIEACALLDRTFQQRRLLEGQSTENIAQVTAIIAEIKRAEGGE